MSGELTYTVWYGCDEWQETESKLSLEKANELFDKIESNPSAYEQLLQPVKFIYLQDSLGITWRSKMISI